MKCVQMVLVLVFMTVGCRKLSNAQGQGHDASAFRGITFFATATSAPCLWLRVHSVESTYTDWGGTCDRDDCTSYAARLNLSDEWEQHTVLFKDLGLEFKDEKDEITNIQFYVPPERSKNMSIDYICNTEEAFDLWIDDVSFVL